MTAAAAAAAPPAARPAWMAPGRSRVSAFLVCREAEAVRGFVRHVFGATEPRAPLYRRNGALWNVELDIGGVTVMLGEARQGFERPGFVYVHVPDARETFDRAVVAGGRPIMPPAPRFYGDLDGGVEDMGGNWWWIATHERSLTDAEIAAAARREEAATDPAEGGA